MNLMCLLMIPGLDGSRKLEEERKKCQKRLDKAFEAQRRANLKSWANYLKTK